MLQLLRSMPPSAEIGISGGLKNILAFETLIAEMHGAVLRTTAVASVVNAMAGGQLLRSSESIKCVVPEPPNVLDELYVCRTELGMSANTQRVVEALFHSMGHAQASVAAFCHDADHWGIDQAIFLNLKSLAVVWHRVSQLALRAVVAVAPDVRRCLPASYCQNTEFLKNLLEEVMNGGRPCLDANGMPFLPSLPQRRPACRRELNSPCIVEHQGAMSRALVRDISSSGLGLERVPPMTAQKVAVIEFEDGRCLAGMVVWAKGSNAGIKLDTPLRFTDPLLGD